MRALRLSLSPAKELRVDREPVTSTSVCSVGYDAESQILEVEFVGGAVYQYFGVTEAHYRGLMTAASKGKYLDRHIESGGFRYSQIR